MFTVLGADSITAFMGVELLGNSNVWSPVNVFSGLSWKSFIFVRIIQYIFLTVRDKNVKCVSF